MDNDINNFTYKLHVCKKITKYENKTNKDEVIEPLDKDLKIKILNIYNNSKKKILFK